jgi:hypothetical protein
MALTGDPIASVLLVSAAESVVISGIPQTYTDLVLVVSGQSTGGGSEWYMWPNGDTAGNETLFSRTYLYGTGSSSGSGRQNPGNNGGYAASICWATNSGTNYSIVQIANYANTNMHKTYLISMHIINGAGYVTRQVTKYASNSAVTSLRFGLYAGQSFTSGSTFDLYGLRGA